MAPTDLGEIGFPGRVSGRSSPRISPRQSQILELVAAALSDKEIARKLGLSPATVRTHLQRFYKDCGTHNRIGAITVWQQTRLHPGSSEAVSVST